MTRRRQAAITDVNPAATNAAVKSFAQQLVALTTDTYGSTSKVNIDTLQPASALTDMHLEWYGMKDDQAGEFDSSNIFNTTRDYVVTPSNDGGNAYNGLGIAAPEDYGGKTLVLLNKPAGSAVSCLYCGVEEGFTNFALCFIIPTVADVGDFVFQLPETEKYAAKTFTIRVAAA